MKSGDSVKIHCMYCDHQSQVTVSLYLPNGGLRCRICNETQMLKIVKKAETSDVYGYNYQEKKDATDEGRDAYGYRYSPPFPGEEEVKVKVEEKKPEESRPVDDDFIYPMSTPDNPFGIPDYL